MDLFELRNNQIHINPDAFPIPEFRTIWDKDKTKTKDKAFRDLSYVYYFTDFKSPYQSFDIEKRKEVLKSDFIKDMKWEPDKDIQAAIEKYQDFQYTASMRFLDAARTAQKNLTLYMEGKEMGEDFDPKEQMYILSNIGKSIESIDKVEDKVKKELSSDEKIRGGGVIRSRER